MKNTPFQKFQCLQCHCALDFVVSPNGILCTNCGWINGITLSQLAMEKELSNGRARIAAEKRRNLRASVSQLNHAVLSLKADRDRWKSRAQELAGTSE